MLWKSFFQSIFREEYGLKTCQRERVPFNRGVMREGSASLWALAVCMISVLFPVIAWAADRPPLIVDKDISEIKKTEAIPLVSYADVLDRATPSVVAVYTTRYFRLADEPGNPHSPNGRDLESLLRQYGFPFPRRDGGGASPRERSRTGVGSGVIFSTDGYVITNHHVVVGQDGSYADEIRIRLADDREFVADIIGSDEKTDVAVLRVMTDAPLNAITIADSDRLRVGDVVFAIGNPMEIGLTATRGIVSAIGRQFQGRILGPGSYENFIQTDASINLGNSGGALVDAWGRLIGINTAIVSRSGGSIGIGFAIPTNMVLRVAENLIESGEVPRGMLGLFPESLDPGFADAFNLESTRGALVHQVQEGSPAERGGIRHGDIIIRIDDIEIESAPQLRLVVSQMMPGDSVQVTIIRDGEKQVVPVVLGSLSGDLNSKGNDSGTSRLNRLEGVSLADLSATSRSEWSLPKDLEGVLIDGVAMDSPFADLLLPGMVLIEVNGARVGDVAAVEVHLKEGVNTFYVWYGGNKRFVVVRLPSE